MTEEELIKEKSGMVQSAPFPYILSDLVQKCKYRPNWQVFLMTQYDRGQGSKGLTLIIHTVTQDTYNPERTVHVNHLFPVPPAAYNEKSWRRWLFNRFLEVETHECAEFFQIDGQRPYAPNHGPGNDPYVIFEEGTLQEKRTNYLGEERDQDAPLPGKF